MANTMEVLSRQILSAFYSSEEDWPSGSSLARASEYVPFADFGNFLPRRSGAAHRNETICGCTGIAPEMLPFENGLPDIARGLRQLQEEEDPENSLQ